THPPAARVREHPLLQIPAGADADQEVNAAIARLRKLSGDSLQHYGNAAAWNAPEPRLPNEMPAEKGIGLSQLVKMLEGGGQVQETWGRGGWLKGAEAKWPMGKQDAPNEGHRMRPMATGDQGMWLHGVGS
ncbi:UNVERIFIED_CONTAM: hypothetical protein K2H54_028303, partial [Gekko kuhli]